MNCQCFLTQGMKTNVSLGGEWRRLLISCGKVYPTRKRKCPDRFAWNQCLSSKASYSKIYGCHKLSDKIDSSLCKQATVCLSHRDVRIKHAVLKQKRKKGSAMVHFSIRFQPSCAAFTVHFNISAFTMWPDQYCEITSAHWETRIPLKWQDWKMTELMVFSYRTLKMHSGKGAGKKCTVSNGLHQQTDHVCSLLAKITDTGHDHRKHHHHTTSPFYLILDLIPWLHIYLRQIFYDGISLRNYFFIYYSAYVAQQLKTMEEFFMLLFYVKC